jgi:hypothetical protein
MKVVLRSSSLVFTLLSIVLNAPISRVKRRVENLEPDHLPNEAPRPDTDERGGLGAESAYQLFPRPRL